MESPCFSEHLPVQSRPVYISIEGGYRQVFIGKTILIGVAWIASGKNKVQSA